MYNISPLISIAGLASAFGEHLVAPDFLVMIRPIFLDIWLLNL